MDITCLHEPGLPRPLMRCRRLIVERHRHVIEARIFRLRIIGASHELLNRGADPTFPGNAERFECRDPGIRKIYGWSAGSTARNLRPTVVLLHKQIRPNIQTVKIGGALRSLRPRSQSRNNRYHQRRQDCEDNDDDE